MPWTLRALDGPIVSASSPDDPRLVITNESHYVTGDITGASFYGYGRYAHGSGLDARCPVARHNEDLAREAVERIKALWLSGWNADEARGVVWPYTGAPLPSDRLAWYTRDRLARSRQVAERAKAIEAARRWREERR